MCSNLSDQSWNSSGLPFNLDMFCHSIYIYKTEGYLNFMFIEL